DQRTNIIRHLSELDMATRLANLAERYNDGDVADIYADLDGIVDTYRRRRGLRATSFIDTPIGELLADEFSDAGLAWRLGVLQRHMRRLRGGDFGIIAARPDKGKTTFITSEVT